MHPELRRGCLGALLHGIVFVRFVCRCFCFEVCGCVRQVHINQCVNLKVVDLFFRFFHN